MTTYFWSVVDVTVVQFRHSDKTVVSTAELHGEQNN